MIQLNIVKFLKKVFIKNIIVFCVILALGLLIDEIPGTGWLNFGSKVSLYGIIFLFTFYNFGIDMDEQLMIKKIVTIN